MAIIKIAFCSLKSIFQYKHNSLGENASFMNTIKSLLDLILQENKIFFFSLICFVSFVSSYLIQSTYFTEDLYYNTFSEQLNSERVHKLFELSSQYKLLVYFIIPIGLILRVLYNSFWVSIGSFFLTGEDCFGGNFNICLKAELVFFTMTLVNLILLFFIKEVKTLNDISLVPFSILSVYPIHEIPRWLQYPLQTANIWEVLYCLFGASLYSVGNNTSPKNSLMIFGASYITGLIAWIIFVMFITLQIS